MKQKGKLDFELTPSINGVDMIDTNDLQSSLDGYALNQDLTEHENQHGLDIKAITDVIDGYALDSNLQSHQDASDSAFDAILTDLDGYALDSNLTSHESQHNLDIKAITDVIDGYAEDAEFSTLDNQVTTIQNSLDGYDNAIHSDVSGEINALTDKASPVGADILIIEDSAASFGKKKVSITNLPDIFQYRLSTPATADKSGL